MLCNKGGGNLHGTARGLRALLVPYQVENYNIKHSCRIKTTPMLLPERSDSMLCPIQTRDGIRLTGPRGTASSHLRQGCITQERCCGLISRYISIPGAPRSQLRVSEARSQGRRPRLSGHLKIEMPWGTNGAVTKGSPNTIVSALPLPSCLPAVRQRRCRIITAGPAHRVSSAGKRLRKGTLNQ